MSLFAVCLAAGADQTDAMLAQPAMVHTLNAVIDEKWVTEMGPGGAGLSSEGLLRADDFWVQALLV